LKNLPMGEGGSRERVLWSAQGAPPRGEQNGQNLGNRHPPGETCRLDTDEQGVRVSKKRYPETVTCILDGRWLLAAKIMGGEVCDGCSQTAGRDWALGVGMTIPYACVVGIVVMPYTD